MWWKKTAFGLSFLFLICCWFCLSFFISLRIPTIYHMKKILFAIFAFISINAFSQIQVKENSFHKIDGFVMLDKESHVDDNEVPMALIKISTEYIDDVERARFEFRGNAITYFDKHPKPGELHLYVSSVATFIEMIHPDYGKTEYWLPEELCGFCGYELVVQYLPRVLPSGFVAISSEPIGADIYIDGTHYGKTNKVITDLEVGVHELKLGKADYDTIVKNFEIKPKQTLQLNEKLPLKSNKRTTLTVKSDQDNAVIYIDNVPFSNKDAKKYFTIGTMHTWMIKCDMYHTEKDTVMLNEKTVVEKKLRPAWGYLDISTFPEDGADVFVDDEYIGKSPLVTEKLKYGIHKVRVEKDDYQKVENEYNLDNGLTTEADITMPADFAVVTINADSESDIYIDDEFKAKGKWSGRLSGGKHLIEARRDMHKASMSEVDLVLGETKNINLVAPKPMTGALKINTVPSSANVYVDGKYKGKSPYYEASMLIGEHEVKLVKQDYAETKINVLIKDGEVYELTETLKTYRDIEIKTDRDGDIIYIDGCDVGRSPCVVNISCENHQLVVKRGNKEVCNKNIFIEKGNNKKEMFLKFGKEINITTMRNGDEIFVNNEYVGKSPLKYYLDYGEYSIKAKRKGNSSDSKMMKVEENGPSECLLCFGKMITISSNKKGDAVFVDGKKQGKTPIELDLSLGSHDVTVKRGNKSDFRSINVSSATSYYSFYPKKSDLKFYEHGVRFLALSASATPANDLSYGLTFGSYKRAGWYASFMTNMFNTAYNHSSMLLDEHEFCVLETRHSASLGLMFRLGCFIYLKLGGVYDFYSDIEETASGWWITSFEPSEKWSVSGGLQFNMKCLNLSTELIYNTSLKTYEFRAGLGIGWRKK